MDPLDTLRIRPGEPGDFARVQKDWKLSYATSDFARFLSLRSDWRARASQTYWDWQSAIVARLLREAELWVACWAEETSAIVGWCVTEPEREDLDQVPRPGPIVHYVNVLPPYRLHGVAKRLLAPALEHPIATYTHRTLACRHLPIPSGWVFDPRPALVPRRRASEERR